MIPESLDALRRTLDSFRITACRVSHERVTFDSGVALRRHVNGVESSFVRVGLCPWDDRNIELACAHTTARHRLVNVVDALAERRLIERDEARLIAEFVEKLANVIHAVDWSKGELEAAYAVALESDAASKADALRVAIQRLESEHSAASRQFQAVVDRLRRIAGCEDHQHHQFERAPVGAG